MMGKAKWYLETWYTVMVRPILFYTFLPEGAWHGEALTFAGATSWVLSFFLTFAIFLIKFIQIGLYLIENLTLWERVLTSPIMIVFAFVFFAMTTLIIGGFILAGILGALWGFAVVLHFVLKLLGGRGTLFETVKALLYSSAVFLVVLIPILFAILTKYRVVEMWQLSSLENVVYYFACIYIFGLWSIAGKKVHDVPRWKAFLAATLPFAILIFFGVLFHSKVFPKLAGFLI
jgi:hypothetical protein